MPDDAVQVGDTWVNPVTDQTTDDKGNTVIVGYPPSTGTNYEGGVSAPPSVGSGLGEGETNPDGSEGA